MPLRSFHDSDTSSGNPSGDPHSICTRLSDVDFPAADGSFSQHERGSAATRLPAGYAEPGAASNSQSVSHWLWRPLSKRGGTELPVARRRATFRIQSSCGMPRAMRMEVLPANSCNVTEAASAYLRGPSLHASKNEPPPRPDYCQKKENPNIAAAKLVRL